MAIGLTEISATSSNAVSAIVQLTLKQSGILLPTITDYSRLAVKGKNVVDVPRRTQFAAADKVENTDLTAQVLTFAVDAIDLDKYKAILTCLEDNAGIQATPNIVAEIVQESAAELVLQLDKDIMTQLLLASAAAPDHIVQWSNNPTNTVLQTDILEARRLLNVASVPQADRFLVIPPDQEKAMLLISDFVRADSYGSPAGVRNAELGRIYGFTVMMWNDATLPATEMVAYHKTHVGYATQIGSKFETDRDVPALANNYAMSWLYGVDVLDSGKRGVRFNTTGA